MNIIATVQVFILTLSATFPVYCGTFLQKSELAREMPAETEMKYRKNGGMARSYKEIKISKNMLFIKSLTGNRREPERFYAEISATDKRELYRVFYENKFDLVTNDERQGIVYDAPSEGIYIRAGRTSKNVSYGKNSPLSGANLRRYLAIKKAFETLEAKYQSKLNRLAENFAVIEYDAGRHGFIFRNARPLELGDEDLMVIDSLVRKSVEDFNAGHRDERRKISEPSGYKFQYVPVTAEKGRKNVWVNALCSAFDRDWKTEIIVVEDGGRCYFNLKIDLENSTVEDFQVNGDA